jgi:putative ABC transport system permease protein
VLSELAQAGMRDGVRRTATTAGPVIVLFGLVVGLLGVLATLTEASRVERVQQITADLVVVSQRDVSDRVRAVPGVDRVDAETDVWVPVQVARKQGGWRRVDSPVVTAVDSSTRGLMTHQPLLAGHLSSFRPGRAVLGSAAPEDGLGTPGTVRVAGVRLPVVARVDTTIADGSDVLVDRADLPDRLLRDAPTTTFVRLTPGASSAQVRAALAELGTVSSVRAWARGLAREQARENNGVMAALAGLGGLYAFFSMVNAVAIGTTQRRREFAVARVTGATRRQVVATAALESLGVGAIGVALGSMVVAVCLLGIRRGVAGTLGVPVLEVPWLTGLLLAGAALCTAAGRAPVAAYSETLPAAERLVAARVCP